MSKALKYNDDASNGYYGRTSRLIPSYAVRLGEQIYISEADATSPPDALIFDEQNACWALGYAVGEKGRSPNGQYCYNVLRNGKETGEFASVISMKKGRVSIFTETGWKRWTGRSFI